MKEKRFGSFAVKRGLAVDGFALKIDFVVDVDRFKTPDNVHFVGLHVAGTTLSLTVLQRPDRMGRP